jgi:hypothetical protein
MMIKILALASASLVFCGTIVAYLATFPRELETLQWLAGAMVIAGLILLGTGLEHVL